MNLRVRSPNPPARDLLRLIGRRAWVLAAAWSLGHGSAAFGELWGYVDERGDAHFATRQLDSRYRLFFNGRSSLDAPSADELASADAFRRSALYQRVVHSPNLERFRPLIEHHARSVGLEPALVEAVVAAESGFDPDAVSAKGAYGLMQLLPQTAARYGVVSDARRGAAQKLLDPALNLRIGARHLHDLLVQFDNDVPLALAAYNAGEQAVLQYGNRVPPFVETEGFVREVERFRSVFSPPAPPSKRIRLSLPRKGSADASIR